MSKRTKRARKILGGLTMSILLLFVTGTPTRAAASRNQRCKEERYSVRAEVTRGDVRFTDRQIRFEEPDAKAQARQSDRQERERTIAEYRAWKRDKSRTFDKTDLRFQRGWDESRVATRETPARINRERSRLDDRSADRSDVEREERTLVAARDSRVWTDKLTGSDREYRTARADG